MIQVSSLKLMILTTFPLTARVKMGYKFITEAVMISLSDLLEAENNSLTPEEVMGRVNSGREKMMQWIADVGRKDSGVHLETNEMWWKQADSNKQKGFYVSLLLKKKDWDGPFKFTKSQYKKGYKIANEFVSKIARIEEVIKSPKAKKLYAEMKRNRE